MREKPGTNPERICERFQPHPPQLAGRPPRNASTNALPSTPACGNVALVDFRSIWQNLGMNPDSHEEIPVTLDEATKAKLDEAVAATGLTAGDVLRLAIEAGLGVMESDRQN